MQVRRLGPADARAFRALRLRGLREHPEAFTSGHDEDLQQPLQVARARLESPLFASWGGFEGVELYGIVGLERETRAKNRHKGTVVGMYVAPEVTGQGVGKALLLAVLAHARAEGLGSLVLTVTENNAAAVGLYQSVGFRSFGIEPDAIRFGGRSHAKNHMHLDLSKTP
jgi:ribosomal protein S18 acetylase RimI-like enzyme